MYELHHIRWYDEQVWERICTTLIQKKQIASFYDFKKILKIWDYMRNDPEHCPIAD